jgi:hypothetical protein
MAKKCHSKLLPLKHRMMFLGNWYRNPRIQLSNIRKFQNIAIPYLPVLGIGFFSVTPNGSSPSPFIAVTINMQNGAGPKTQDSGRHHS